jgi:HK97 family phage major capsid protein
MHQPPFQAAFLLALFGKTGMSKLTEIREKQAKLVADARTKLDEIKDDTTEARAKEIEAEYDRIMAEHDRLDARAQKEEELAKREAALERGDPRRPTGEDRTLDPNAPAEEQVTVDSAFRSFLRYGPGNLMPEERKVLATMRVRDQPERRAQATTPDAAGGFLVPQGFMAELVKRLAAWGPMLDPGVTRQLETTAGNQLDWPGMDDTANTGVLLAENTADTDLDLVFNNRVLDAFKYSTRIIRVSEELLQDSAVDLEAIIRDAMAERIGRIVNQHLTVGTGTAQPNGIVTAASAGPAAGAAAAITFDDLIELEHSVDPAYRADPSCRFMMRDTTLKTLRKLKDLEGNYIWQPSDARSGAPATLLGYAYSINQAMAAVGASARSVVFGPFNRYIVRRVRELIVKRLVERYAEAHQVGFIGFARFDGEILDANAIKALVHPAS